MNPNKKIARIAGFMFLLIVIGWTLNWIFVDSKIHAAGNVMATVNKIMANELLFRIGIANELIFSISGMVLALALYIILKPVNKNLALLALCWKLMDAIIGTVNVLVTFIVLQMVNGKAAMTVCKPEHFRTSPDCFSIYVPMALRSPCCFLAWDLWCSFIYYSSPSMFREYWPALESFHIFSFS
jgi:hypothetical protein